MEKSEIEAIYRKYFRDVFLYIRALSENESHTKSLCRERSYSEKYINFGKEVYG